MFASTSSLLPQIYLITVHIKRKYHINIAISYDHGYFIKWFLIKGCSLIKCFSFGANKCLDQLRKMKISFYRCAPLNEKPNHIEQPWF